jgi:hypothetical protein
VPRLDGAKITKAWWHRDEGSDRIHYTVTRADGWVRHLYADAPSALHTVLREHLDAVDYSGPGGDTDT